MRPITPKQIAFLDALERPHDEGGAWWNATAAARMAGYRWPNKVASRLLQIPAVHAEAARRFMAATGHAPRRSDLSSGKHVPRDAPGLSGPVKGRVAPG